MKKSRQRLVALYELSGAVPFPASGSQSTTIAGMSSYVEDMRYFQPRFNNIMMSLLEEEAGIAQDDMTFGDPDTLIVALKMWIDQRVQEGWETNHNLAIRARNDISR